MKLFVYSIRDAKTESYSTPFFQVSKGSALRMFSDLVVNPEATISRHPEDFALFELGEWDDNLGKIVSFDQPLHIANAIEFSRPKVVNVMDASANRSI